MECYGSLSPIKGIKCNLCGKPLISEKETCLSCRGALQRSCDRLWSVFPYTGKYSAILREYKFNKNLKLASFLAEKILSVLSEPSLKEAVIVPVPPRRGKIKESGWDQVDYIIKKISFLSKNVSVSRCLRRGKSKIQKNLSRPERMENLKGRISVRGQVPKTALIIDDVITTGSTIEICSSALKENGAEKVFGLCLFYD